MRKFTKVIALTAALTMLLSTVVMAAGSSTTTETNPNWGRAVEGVATTTNTQATVAQQAAAPAPAYTVGVTSTTPGETVAPVNAATVNYANLAAKLLVSPTAVVYKSAVISGNSKNVSLSVAGLANGQKVTVLAYDLATGTWKKISATVKNGTVTFKKGNSTIFSLVVDVMAP